MKKLHYDVSGSGPTIIVQGPGWGPSSDYLRLTLAPLLEGFRVVTFDPRNVGRSARVDEDDAQRTGALIEDLEGLRRLLGLERCVLIGHSHGSLVAVGYAIRHPKRVRGLVLANPVIRAGTTTGETEAILERLAEDPRRAEAVALYRQTGDRPDGIASDRDLARWARGLMPLYFRDLDALRRFELAIRHATPLSHQAWKRMPAEPEAWIEAGLSSVSAPTVILTGRHDLAAPPSEAEHIHSLISGSKLAVLDYSGHHPWVEEPAEFKRLIRAFFRHLALA